MGRLRDISSSGCWCTADHFPVGFARPIFSLKQQARKVSGQQLRLAGSESGAEMNHVTLEDGCRLAWRMEGPEAAPVVVLAHALGASSAMWQPQADSLTDQFRVLRYDSRGHGASDVTPGPYTIERLGRDVLGLLDALGRQQVAFCGLSMGGFVGQWLGVNAPERLNRLVLANTTAYMGPPEAWIVRIETALQQGMPTIADAALERWFTPAFRAHRPETVNAIRQIILANDPLGYASCAAAIAVMDQRESLRQITVPTLVLGGSEDPATPVSCAEELHAAISGSRLEILPSAHLSNIEQAERFNALLRTFLT